MNVVLLVPSISFDTRVNTPTIRLFVECVSKHARVYVVSIHYPTTPGVTDHGSLTVRAIGTTRMSFRRIITVVLHSLWREHRRQPFDLVHGLWLHEPGSLAVMVGRLLRIPSVVSIGGSEVTDIPEIDYGHLRTRRGPLYIPRVLSMADHVTGGSTYVLDLAREIQPERANAPFRRIPLPIDTSLFSPAEGRQPYDPRRPRLLHAASLIPVKDQTLLLRAFAEIRERIPEATLTIAGEDPFGHRARLEQLRDDLGIADAVRFLGAVPHHEMPAVYADADLFLLTSYHESQGMVVLEAAASGVPTVATAVGVVPDLAPDAALSVASRDPAAFASAVVGVLHAPDRLRSMGVVARQRVVRDYDATPISNQWHDLYREVTARRSRR